MQLAVRDGAGPHDERARQLPSATGPQAPLPLYATKTPSGVEKAKRAPHSSRSPSQSLDSMRPQTPAPLRHVLATRPPCYGSVALRPHFSAGLPLAGVSRFPPLLALPPKSRASAPENLSLDPRDSCHNTLNIRHKSSLHAIKKFDIDQYQSC